MNYSLQNRDLLSLADLTKNEIELLLERAETIKGSVVSNASLSNKTVALLFEKPSLRTRVSFETAVHQLGGHSIVLGQQEIGIGTREPVADIAKVLSRYVDCIVYRTFDHDNLAKLAQYASIPVINALSDNEHPCQALADLLTIKESKGRIQDVLIAYIGDGNNVATSLAIGAITTGAIFRMACPAKYRLEPIPITPISGERQVVSIKWFENPTEAVTDADVVYADVWTSMGQELEQATRIKDFSGYKVTEDLMSFAKSDAVFMHPMPAHYDQEIPAGFLDNDFSVAYDQAENRLHVQKALLEAIVG